MTDQAPNVRSTRGDDRRSQGTADVARTSRRRGAVRGHRHVEARSRPRRTSERRQHRTRARSADQQGPGRQRHDRRRLARDRHAHNLTADFDEHALTLSAVAGATTVAAGDVLAYKSTQTVSAPASRTPATGLVSRDLAQLRRRSRWPSSATTRRSRSPQGPTGSSRRAACPEDDGVRRARPLLGPRCRRRRQEPRLQDGRRDRRGLGGRPPRRQARRHSGRPRRPSPTGTPSARRLAPRRTSRRLRRPYATPPRSSGTSSWTLTATWRSRASERSPFSREPHRPLRDNACVKRKCPRDA
jgi:hypothetical protein